VELIGVYLMGCGLLAVAGIVKAVRPDDTARALAVATSIPLRTMRALVRLGSGVEAAVGITALVVPRPWSAAMVAVSYAAFAAFVAYAKSTGGAIASCGCFGTPDTPATWLHVVINTALALSAALVAWSAPTSGSIIGVLSGEPDRGIPLVLVSALGAWLVYLAISVMATLRAARSLTGITFDRRVPSP
jgi:hypothetical protein